MSNRLAIMRIGWPGHWTLRAESYVERVLTNLDAITRACTEGGPFIYVLHPHRIECTAL
jgi:hypothetical protein